MITVCDPNAFLVQPEFRWADDFGMGDANTTRTLDRHALAYVLERKRVGSIQPETADHLLRTLLSFSRSFGNRPLNRLTERAVERWLEQHREWKASTKRARWSQVHGWCRWMLNRGIIAKDPFLGARPPRVPRLAVRTIPRAGIGELYAAAPDARGKLIVGLMHELGLRAVEVSRLDIEHIDWHRRTVRVNGKGGHERVVPITDRLVALIETYLVQFPAAAGPLIRGYNHGDRVRPGTISGWLRVWLYEAGLKKFPHDRIGGHALRRTAATETYAATKDIAVVKELLGHADYASVTAYVAAADVSRMREALDLRDRLGAECAT